MASPVATLASGASFSTMLASVPVPTSIRLNGFARITSIPHWAARNSWRPGIRAQPPERIDPLDALVLGGGAEVVERPLDLLADFLRDQVQDRLHLDPAHRPLLAAHDGLGLGRGQVEPLRDRRGVLPPADEDVAGVHVHPALQDVRVRGLVPDVHEGHDLVALSRLVVLVLRLEREDVDVHHHDVQPAGFDHVRVALDLALLHGDQHHFELGPVLPEDLEVDVHVVDVERDVLLGLPADGLTELALGHLREVDALGDDGAAGDADDRFGGLDAALDQRLPDGLLDRVGLLDLAALDGAGRHLGDAEPDQLVGRPLRPELDHLDRAGADVEPDDFDRFFFFQNVMSCSSLPASLHQPPRNPRNYFI